MKFNRNRYPRFFVSHRHLLLIIGVSIALAAIATLPFLSTSASSLPSRLALPAQGELAGSQLRMRNSSSLPHGHLTAGRSSHLMNVALPLAETIATYAADCTTPKSSFVVGETVCAKTDGVDLNFPGGRWVHWLDDSLNIAHGGSGVTDITTNPQTFSYTVTSVGTWKATIAETGDISQTPAGFTVSPPPPIATYAGDCTTPKTLFNYGDTICAKVTGIDSDDNRRIAWVDPGGYVRETGGNVFTPITTDPQSFTFVLPSTDTSIIDVFTTENRGAWRANVVSNRGAATSSAPFILQGPALTSNLVLSEGLSNGGVNPGGAITYLLAITNEGPERRRYRRTESGNPGQWNVPGSQSVLRSPFLMHRHRPCGLHYPQFAGRRFGRI